jgi:hypothetical protein
MLKSIWLKVALSLLIVVSLAGDSLAQTRIAFGRGRTSANLSGTLAPGGMRTYLLRVSAGQTITVQVNSANNRVEGDVDYPSGDHLDNTDRGYWQGDTTENGSYRISMINNGSRATRYTFTVTVR